MSRAFFLSFLFLAASATGAPGAEKGLFVSVLQKNPALSSKRSVEKLIATAKKENYKVLFVQVYRANQAWFPSRHAENKPGELAYLVRRAHEEGLQAHAWLNLLSLSANERAPLLQKYGPSILTRNTAPKKTLADYKIDNQYFLEPGDPRVSQALSDILTELITAYPKLDGIQLDYIRYPDVKPSYGHTELNLARYRKAGGKSSDEQDPTWRKWKRDQVTALARRLRDKARSVRPGIQFSTTGLMPYPRAREEAFQDWKEWTDTGLADFVTLMAYTDDMKQFQRYIVDAKNRLPGLAKTNIAVGAYKLKDRPEDFARQWALCEASGARSCVKLEL